MVKRRGTIFLIIWTMAGWMYRPTPEIQTFFTPGPDCENHIIHEINNTKSTLDIAVYSVTNPNITNAIIDAHKRGVRVRIITDRTQANIKNAMAPILRNAGIPVITNKRHRLIHHKFAIFDNRRVVSGSFNWTVNATRCNAENCDFWDVPDDKYQNRFEYLWDMYTDFPQPHT